MKDSKVVQDAAWDTVGRLPTGTDKQEFGSLVGILVITGIIVNVVQLNRLCTESLATIARNPSKLQDKILRREIRRAMTKEHGYIMGYFYYRKYGEQTRQAILKTGAEMSAQRMAELREAV